MSPRWTSYVAPKPPKGGSKRKVSKIWTISCDNSETVRNRMSVLITNRKSHTGFRLAPTSMTLNDLERRNSLYFAFFTEFDSFVGNYATVVEDTPIMSAECIPVLVFHYWPKVTHPAALFLCDSWGTCYSCRVNRFLTFFNFPNVFFNENCHTNRIKYFFLNFQREHLKTI